MARNLLSDTTLKGIKKNDPRKRLNDGEGLYLLLFVKGGAHGWRFDYTFEATRKTISLGTYPDTSLALARNQRDTARQQVAGGIDPSEARKAERVRHVAQKAAKTRMEAGEPEPDSFRAVFRDWLATRRSGWSEKYASKVEAGITRDVLPWLGDSPIDKIDERDLLECVRRVQDRGAVDSAHSTLQNCGQVFRFAIASGIAKRNPAQGMSGALKSIVVKHMAALIDPAKFGDLMQSVDDYTGSPLTKTALQLAALTFQRPINIRSIEWSELDLKGAKWVIPSAKMKRKVADKINGKPHLVPLSPQAVALLREIQPLTGKGRYVFPSLLTGERCMSDNTMNTALRRLGFSKEEATAHGFRASARTILVDHCAVDPEVIEAQLAHGKSGPLGGAYDRTEYVAKRRAAMCLWADVIDHLRKGKAIEKFKKPRAKTGT